MKHEVRVTKNPDLIQITTTDERWYMHQKSGAFYPSSTWIASYTPKPGLMKWVGAVGLEEAERIKQTKGEKGGRVHNAIEGLLVSGHITLDAVVPDANGELKELSAEEWEAVMSFVAWLDEMRAKEPDIELLAIEEPGFNDEFMYAGTRDLRLRIGQQTWTIDIKTSANIYTDHKAQVASYGRFPDALSDRLGIIQVGYERNKKGFKFTEIEREKFGLFLAAMTFWKAENENAQPYQRDYPTALTLMMPKADGVRAAWTPEP